MPTRRNFLTNAAAFAVVAPGQSSAAKAPPTILKLRRRTIEVNKKPGSLLRIERDGNLQGLTMRVGDRFRVRVENELEEPSLVHWHGMTPPWRQDGVPFISAPPIPPGGGADYDFPLAFEGTYWIHSHYGLQEQSLMDTPLIILPSQGGDDRQDIVICLNDFSFTPAKEIFASLRRHGKTMPGIQTHFPEPTNAESMKPMPMPSATRDLNDVKYDAYLANERTLDDPEVIKVEIGGRVRLRIINSSAMTNFHVDLGTLEGFLVAVDGHDVVAARGHEFPIACAQRLDILLDLPKGGGEAFPVFFIVEGERRRAGVILAPPGASVGRVEELAKEPSAPLDLTFESTLRAAGLFTATSSIMRRPACSQLFAINQFVSREKSRRGLLNDVENHTATPLHHAAQHRLGSHDDATHIDVHSSTPGIFVAVVNGAEWGETGVVAQSLSSSASGGGPCRQGWAASRRGCVARPPAVLARSGIDQAASRLLGRAKVWGRHHCPVWLRLTQMKQQAWSRT